MQQERQGNPPTSPPRTGLLSWASFWRTPQASQQMPPARGVSELLCNAEKTETFNCMQILLLCLYFELGEVPREICILCSVSKLFRVSCLHSLVTETEGRE